MTDESTTTTPGVSNGDAEGQTIRRVRSRTRSRRGGDTQPESRAAAEVDEAATGGRPEDRPGADDREDAGVIRRRQRKRGSRGGVRRAATRGRDEAATGGAPTIDETPATTPAAAIDAPFETVQEAPEPDADTADVAAPAAEAAATTEPSRRRSRSRARGRGKAARGRTEPKTDKAADADEVADRHKPDDADVAPTPDERAAAVAGPATTPTRLQSRNRARGRGRSRRQGRPLGGVSEETRRAITEGPPRRMLVTVGGQRTQIAVLEERTLVEHYVTRQEDVSYVGNIYMGRVQNVLPGMEAAFVDIGKGRNGVLYAGEVNYDEADLEGELPRIENTLKPGQTLLVQVTKDPMGTKGARLTQHLSIAGRYSVLAPGEGMLGISRKLTDEERDRLRTILKDIKPDDFGLIVRTAAEGATREQLEADVSRLTRKWQHVQERASTAKALEPVYEEPGLVMRVIRDVFGTEFSDLIVDSDDMAEQIRDYLRDVTPEMADKVGVHSGEDSLFDAYEVTTQVRRALEKKVWLRSGGYLIVEKTEAMWVIDVNTGKFVGSDNLEETVLRNNLEAADEIARQLRLRDMGGIIVIDFVDMLVPANRSEVLKRFKRELARDKTKSRVMDISKLGLVQMTRKNVSQGLTETFTTRCDVCEGRGARILDEAFH